MSKNQRHGNREAKKPKKEKLAATPAAATEGFWATLNKLKAQDRDKK
jgi:hypothetical protein